MKHIRSVIRYMLELMVGLAASTGAIADDPPPAEQGTASDRGSEHNGGMLLAANVARLDAVDIGDDGYPYPAICVVLGPRRACRCTDGRFNQHSFYAERLFQVFCDEECCGVSMCLNYKEGKKKS